MGEKIALGFHATVDFELEWNREIFLGLLLKYNICEAEIREEVVQDSERNMLIGALAHMRQGSGGEFTPATNELCLMFAEHFSYRQTIGGTAVRAAVAISKLGYGSELSVCCFNRLIKAGLPKNIRCYSNVEAGREEIFPHVVFTYPANVRIQVNDIDFVTPRESRIMYSNDEESKQMVIAQGFSERMHNVETFLLGCFSEILNFEILKQRLKDTRELLGKKRPPACLVFEDGCYIQKKFRVYVHQELMKCGLHILSMNEDELQEYTGKRFNVLDSQVVLDAVLGCRENIGVPILVVHSSKWALACGEEAEGMENALKMGVLLSATHFCFGSHFKKEDFRRVSSMEESEEGKDFCRKIKMLAGKCICAVPTKNLTGVHNPFVVGLGDCFAGGLVLGLTENISNI